MADCEIDIQLYMGIAAAVVVVIILVCILLYMERVQMKRND